MSVARAAGLLLDHPCLGVPRPVFAGLRVDPEGPAGRPGRLSMKERFAVAAQCLATASLLWEMGYWAGCAALANAAVTVDEDGPRVTLGAIPRPTDAVVQRLGGGDAAIRRLRDRTVAAIAQRSGLGDVLFAGAGGADWLGFDPWLERILDRLKTPLDPWTARSLWAVRLRPLPLPGPGEIGYWSVVEPAVAARLAAAAWLGLREITHPVVWLTSGGGDTGTAPALSAGGGGGALVLSGELGAGELHAVERWLGSGASRRVVVVGAFPPGWAPEVPRLMDDGGVERSLLLTGAGAAALRRVRHRLGERFGENRAEDSKTLASLAVWRFSDRPARRAPDETTEALERCLSLSPDGVPPAFLAACTGLDEGRAVARARRLGAVSREGRWLLPAAGPLRPDPLHARLAPWIPPEDPRRLVASWLGGGGGEALARWARERLNDLDGVAVLRALAPVAPDALGMDLLELLAEAALEARDLALLRPLAETMEGSTGRVWKACMEAMDAGEVASLPEPDPADVPLHPRAVAETGLRLLEFRTHRGRGEIARLVEMVLEGAERLGGLLGRSLALEARLMADPDLLEDREWRKRAVAGSARLGRTLRRRAGVIRMGQGRYREAFRLLAPLAEAEELPGRAGLMELDVGAMALAEGRWARADRHLLRALRLLRAAGFTARTRVVSFDLAVGELDRLRIEEAARRFAEAGAGEGDPVARAELARLALARGDEEELHRLLEGLPRGENADAAGLAEAVAMLDGVAALLRHDLPRARPELAAGGDEGLAWGLLAAALDGGASLPPPKADGWDLGFAARLVGLVREARETEAEALFREGCGTLRRALALALCERLLGRQRWIGERLRRETVEVLRSGGMAGWAGLLEAESRAGRRVMRIATRLLDEGDLEAVPREAWEELLAVLGVGGLEVRTLGEPVWRIGEGSPAGEIHRGPISLVPLDASEPAGPALELLAAVLATAGAGGVDHRLPEDDLGMIGRSAALRELRREIRQLAPGRVPVLLLGETGSGKELAARAVHRLSGRRGPFVPINMASLPRELAEAELFGAVKGAFTGADRTRRGLIVSAEGGTLFLDEIGELELRLQAKLLRFLETGEVRPLGSESLRAVDVRVVAATNRDLAAAQREGAFRPDLFYRIASAVVRIPPLRERAGDIPLLTAWFTREVAMRTGTTAKWGNDALRALERHSWPGNVRELRNVVEVALLRAGGGTVRVEHLGLEGSVAGGEENGPLPTYEQAIRSFRRRLIERALQRNGGNRSAAARELGISRQTLLYHIRSLGIA